jgi:hypothetical protein
MPEILKKVHMLTQQQVAEIGTFVLERNVDELKKIIADKNSSVLQVMTASVAAKIISKGDATAYNALLDRIIGRVRERIQIAGDPNSPLTIQAVQGLTQEQIDARIIELARKALGDGE